MQRLVGIDELVRMVISGEFDRRMHASRSPADLGESPDVLTRCRVRPIAGGRWRLIVDDYAAELSSRDDAIGAASSLLAGAGGGDILVLSAVGLVEQVIPVSSSTPQTSSFGDQTGYVARKVATDVPGGFVPTPPSGPSASTVSVEFAALPREASISILPLITEEADRSRTVDVMGVRLRRTDDMVSMQMSTTDGCWCNWYVSSPNGPVCGAMASLGDLLRFASLLESHRGSAAKRLLELHAPRSAALVRHSQCDVDGVSTVLLRLPTALDETAALLLTPLDPPVGIHIEAAWLQRSGVIIDIGLTIASETTALAEAYSRLSAPERDLLLRQGKSGGGIRDVEDTFGRVASAVESAAKLMKGLSTISKLLG